MTEREAEEFMIDVALVAIPAARKFILMNSSDPKATVKAQCKALLKIDVHEAASVVDRWLAGTLKEPTQAETEMLALAIKQVVMNDRGVESRRKPLEEIRKHRSEYSRPQALVEIEPYYLRILKLGKDCRIGEITLDAWRSGCDEIVAEFEAASKLKGRVYS